MENKLQVIVKESGLDETKAQLILTKFQDYFQLAAEWEARAKTITVTDATQKAEMEIARTGRLFLREKRIAIEKTRKEMKEQSLREGKAIDGLANVLKSLIVPTEEYLERQERYVEIKAEEELRRIQIEIVKKAEADRLAKEKAEAEERERMRLENIRLRAEAEAKEKALAAERRAADAKLAAAKAQADKERKQMEEKARKEREEQRKTAEAEIAKVKARAEAERQAMEVKLAEEKARAEMEREVLQDELAKRPTLQQVEAETEKEKVGAYAERITCPKCGEKFFL